MATKGTPILGNNGFLAVGKTLQLSNANAGGTWVTSDVTIASVDSTGLVTGIGNGDVTITYNYTIDVTDYTSIAYVTVLSVSYTNGFDISRILPELIGRKGWIQPTQSDFPFTLDSTNLSCLSRRFYNQDHAINSAYTLWCLQEDSGISEDNFNKFLKDLQVGAVMAALNAVFRLPSIVEQPTLIHEKQFRTVYKIIPNTGQYAGWQLKIAAAPVSLKIDSLIFMATAPCTVTINLFNDVVLEPLATKTITVTEGYTQTIINPTDLFLTRLDDVHKGGIFYVNYSQDELAGQGVNAVDVYLTSWGETFNWGFQAFIADKDPYFTFKRQSYYSNWHTYGLNIEGSVYWNFTNMIVRQSHEFDNLVGYFMTQKCIELAMQSMRSGKEQIISQDKLYDLYHYLEGTQKKFKSDKFAVDFDTSLKGRIELEVKRIQQTFYPKDVVQSVNYPDATPKVYRQTAGGMF